MPAISVQTWLLFPLLLLFLGLGLFSHYHDREGFWGQGKRLRLKPRDLDWAHTPSLDCGLGGGSVVPTLLPWALCYCESQGHWGQLHALQQNAHRLIKEVLRLSGLRGVHLPRDTLTASSTFSLNNPGARNLETTLSGTPWNIPRRDPCSADGRQKPCHCS